MKRIHEAPQLNSNHIMENRVQDSTRYLYGLYKGYVVSTYDPLGLGRAKVRVPTIHGWVEVDDHESGAIANRDLPWAQACGPAGGGGADQGGFNPPGIGTQVWVMFEHGLAEKPIWIGSWYSASSGGAKVAVPPENRKGDIQRKSSAGNKTMEAPPGSRVSRESQSMAYHEPTVATWGKSLKGHTLQVEDRDGAERLTITDRAGNVFVMDCPIPETFNAGNAEQRRGRSVITGDAVEREKMRDLGSKLYLQDQSQSLIEMDSRMGDEKISIIANDGEGGIQTGKNRQKIEMLAGANRIMIESVNGGKLMSRITLDANTGVITLEGEVVIDLVAPYLNISAEHMNINSDLNINGDVVATGRITGGGV